MSTTETQPDRIRTANQKTLVVIGNGPVGFALLEKLCSLRVNTQWKILVFGEEPGPAYDRIRLTELFSGRNDVRLDLASMQWYIDHGIELFTNERIISIDRQKQQVISDSSRIVSYDHLVLACGSRAFLPPVPGIESEGVFVYRTQQDVEKIRAYGKSGKCAAVIGSGLLGLEAATALHQMGLQTHVVEVASAIMPKQLDNEAAKLLQHQLEEVGLNFHLLYRTQSIVRNDHKLTLTFDCHDSIEMDLIVVAAGIRPRDELADYCGLLISEHGGIVINDKLQTSDHRIFAIGECAVHREIHYGLVAPGRQMADVLANNLAGGNESFLGSDFSTRLKVMGVDVCTLGDYLQSNADYDHIAWTDQYSYRKIVLKSGHIVGGIIVGQTIELSRLHQAILNEESVSIWQKNRFRMYGRVWGREEAEHITSWPDDAVVCNCMKVTKSQLRHAFEAGCITAEQLSSCTRAGTVCGSCRPLLSEFAGDSSSVISRLIHPRLLVCSCLTLVTIICWLTYGPVPSAQSITSGLYPWQSLWTDFVYQQVTGFSALGFVAVAMLFSLRKRWRRFQWGKFPDWRLCHAFLSLMSLGFVMLHTGMKFGHNLNAALLVVFLLVCSTGSLTGIATSWSGGVAGASSGFRIRPFLFNVHVMLFLPLPVLIAFHIISAYYFGN